MISDYMGRCKTCGHSKWEHFYKGKFGKCFAILSIVPKKKICDCKKYIDDSIIEETEPDEIEPEMDEI